MVDYDEILEPDGSQARDRPDVPALVLAPAVLRMVIAGKDIETEIDALVAAVEILQGPDGFMRGFVYEMAADLARNVEASGTRGLADAAKTGLNPDEAALAVRIGLVAIFSSPLGEDGDIGILSAIAERVGLSEADFAKAFERARQAVAQP